MKTRLAAVVLLFTLLVGSVAPSFAGQAHAATQTVTVAGPAQTTVSTGRIKFAIHAGLAFFAFHHYVYNRFKRHQFNPGAPFRRLHIIEAAIALLFTYHELKIALADANGSNSTVLHHLAAPLNALVAHYKLTLNRFNSGNVSGSDLQNLYTSTNAFTQKAGTAGYQITDVPVTIPGA